MRLCLKALLVGAIVLMAVIPGAYGLDIGVSGGSAGANSAVHFAIDADIDASVNARVLVNGASLSPMIETSGNSDLDESYTASDGKGNSSTITAKVTNGRDIVYSPTISEDAAEASQTLSVKKADSIECYQAASNTLGMAFSGVNIVNGLLTNYYGSASAGKSLITGQSFDYAKGNEITAFNFAMVDNAIFGTMAQVNKGSISNYQGLVGASKSQVLAVQGFDNAEGEKVSATNLYLPSLDEIPSVNVSTRVSGGSLENYQGIVGIGFVDTDAADPSKIAYQAFDNATGHEINILEYAIDSSNLNGVGRSIDIKDGVISDYNPPESLYYLPVRMNSSGAELFGLFGSASGKNIEIQSLALQDGNISNVHTVIENGIINGQMTYMGAGDNLEGPEKTGAFVLEMYGGISGTSVNITSLASNGADYVSGSTQLNKGSLDGLYNAAGVLPDEVVAGQFGSSVTGKSLALSVQAANLTSTITNTTIVPLPIAGYTNIANVTLSTGKITVEQP